MVRDDREAALRVSARRLEQAQGVLVRRYRVLRLGFDSRPWMLGEKILDSWDPRVKEQWRANQQHIREALLDEYGPFQAELKARNFVDFGRIPFSVFAFHNRFVAQIQRSFVVGAYYPALTGACALGERILNHLVILLRGDYRGTPQYKRVYSKASVDNWDLAIDTLQAWQVLLPESIAAFRELRSIRARAIHFRPEVDTTDRSMALDAGRCLLRIVEEQFGPGGGKPWIIANTPGKMFITKEGEALPFVKRVYLPNCRLVGPKHRLKFEGDILIVQDDHEYEDREVSDDEFRELRKAATGAG